MKSREVSMGILEIKLPNYPNKVDIEKDVKDNGSLLTDEQWKKAIQYIEDKKVNWTRVLKDNGTETGFSVYQYGDPAQYCAVYYGQKAGLHLGKGAEGIVKFAISQNGEALAVKAVSFRQLLIQAASQHYLQENIFEAEKKRWMAQAAIAKKTGITADIITRDTKYKGQAVVLITDFIPGIPLSDYCKEQKKIITIPTHAILIASHILDEAKKIKDKNILHRDYKTDNIMINPMNGDVRIFDYGLAVTLPPGKDTIIENLLSGTVDHLPWDILRNQEHQYQYNEKSEVYALGITMGELFNVLYRAEIIRLGNSKFFRYIIQDHELDKHYQVIPKELLDRIILFLKRMTDNVPQNRPTIAECQHFFKEILHTQLSEQIKEKAIAILDINEYSVMTEEEKKNIKKTLTNFQGVVIVDGGDQFRNNKDYLLLRREFEKEKIPVFDRVFACHKAEQKAQLVQCAAETVESTSNDNNLRSYFWLKKEENWDTASKLQITRKPTISEQKKEEQVLVHEAPVSIGSSDMKNKIAHACHDAISQSTFDRVILFLIQEKQRLDNRIKQDPEYKTNFNSRKRAIDETIENMQKQQGTITYQGIMQALSELQIKMNGTSGCWNVIGQYIFSKSESESKIKLFKKTLQAEENRKKEKFDSKKIKK